MDCEIELAEEFRPSGLAAHQELSSGEVFQVFVVRDDTYGGGGAFQVMMPGGECLKDHQELLIVSIVVQLHSSKDGGVKGEGVDLIVRASNGEDGSNGVVGGVRFD